jgi:hypothetical protein
MTRISRRGLAAMIALLALTPAAAPAAEALKEIRIDWATYNPVSLILKQKGLLEKEFAKDGIRIVWVQSAGSNKALEFLNAGSIDLRLDRRLGGAGRPDQRQPDQIDLRVFAPRVDGAGDDQRFQDRDRH